MHDHAARACMYLIPAKDASGKVLELAYVYQREVEEAD